MKRRLVAAALCVLVHGFVQTSPFVHTHPDDHGLDHAHHGSPSHHHSTPVHAHLGGHGPAHHADGPAVEARHEDAVYLPLFVAEPRTAFDLAIAGPEALVEVQPDETAGHTSVHITHGHDPPQRSTSSPRAPPAPPAFS